MFSLEQLRRGAGANLADGFFRGASYLGSLHPRARPHAHGVEVIQNIPYDPAHPELCLDVWKPQAPSASPRPAVFYVHGGGFRILSKNTHWIMALLFARKGYTVFMIDYRLAPQNPFPAAIEDISLAYAWVVANAHHYEADPQKLILAGESAGANLVTTLAMLSCYERPEPSAQTVYKTYIVPTIVLPACGMHQVTHPERFQGNSRFIQDRLEEVTHAYIGHLENHKDPSLDLADPVRWLERGESPSRPLPSFFLTCGTADPLLRDTERLHKALLQHKVHAEARYYLDEPHAFHAFIFRKSAQRHWRDTFVFLDQTLSQDHR